MQRRMLILEDDAILRKHLCRLLERKGFEVCSAASVSAFLGWALRIRFNALLLDLSLPDGNGLEAWERARDAQSGAVVILMTAHGNEDVASRAGGLGIRTLLAKPLDVSLLLAALGAATPEASTHEAFQPSRPAPEFRRG